MEDLQKLQNEIINRIFKNQEEWLEYTVRTYAVPKIKGEITRGKLKWRGMRLCSRMETLKSVYWVEQREVKIGEYFNFGIKINLDL